jgi:hypothetical protein
MKKTVFITLCGTLSQKLENEVNADWVKAQSQKLLITL